MYGMFFFFSSRRRHTRFDCDWSSDVCSSDLFSMALADLSAIAIEKARLYERIVDVEEQLRRNEKLSALGLLAAEVAHEIRNPLTVMKMLYHSLDLKFPGGDPRAKDAQIMGEKMEHLNRIVEQILDFSRTSQPQFV